MEDFPEGGEIPHDFQTKKNPVEDQVKIAAWKSIKHGLLQAI